MTHLGHSPIDFAVLHTSVLRQRVLNYCVASRLRKGLMRRRDFITLLGGAVTWPLAARAQQGERMKRLGILMAYPEGDQEGQAFLAAFREEFEKLGWMEGRNIWIDTRWAPAADAELRLKFAKELVALHPELVH
jgi:putative tryptophan/tyrosine transport system substrate-binding protein